MAPAISCGFGDITVAEEHVGQLHDLPDPADLRPLEDGRIDLWVASVADWAGRASVAERSAADAARAASYACAKARERFTTSRFLLRRLLAGYLGAAPEDVTVEPGPFGKLRLVGRWADARLTFNLSRSADTMAFAFAAGREIGVDVESRRASSLAAVETMAIAERFTAEESALLRSRPAAEVAPTFLRLWVSKEACLKCRGTGLSTPLDEIAIRFSGPLRGTGRCGDDDYALHGFAAGDGGLGAVAITGTTIPEPRVTRLANR